MANYYRKFVASYSKKVASLTDLLKKDQPWVWIAKCQEAFEELKVAISFESVLKLSNFMNSFECIPMPLIKLLGVCCCKRDIQLPLKDRN